MKKTTITCIECPVGCTVRVEIDEGKVVSVTGNSCPRGKTYAETEVVNPKRVVTSTVRMQNGKILSVKTSVPVEKGKIFEVMQKINQVHPAGEVEIGAVLLENIADGVHLVAADNSKFL